MDAVEVCRRQIDGLRKYFRNKNTPLHRTIVQADMSYTPLNLKANRFVSHQVKSDDEKMLAWRSKELHGRFCYDLQKENVDTEASVGWLKSGIIYPETEGFMISIQDQVVNTRNYQKHILKEDIPTDRCRRCKGSSETIEHILSSCPSLAATSYLERHNKVGVIIYLEVLRSLSIPIENEEPYYKYKPPPVFENQTVKIYWDKAIITDLTVAHNRPDITIIDKNKKTALLIDVSIPNNNNIESKFAEKIRKYSDLRREIMLLWELREVQIVPIIMSSMGLVPKSLKKCFKDIGISWNTHRMMQKSVILDATHIARMVLES